MERLYRFLKILIVVLLIAVVLVGLFVAIPRQDRSDVIAEAQNLAPDFSMFDIDGNEIKLSDFRGKPVILNFWASWCGPCKAEMPDFEEAYKTYGEDIQFLMVNLTDGTSETVESALGYIWSQEYTFPVYYDISVEGAMKYNVRAIPVTFFIDAEGAMKAFNEGMITADVLEDNIAALLKK